MAGYFTQKLLDLLPPLYRESDTGGDLRAFLAIPAETLDELKQLIDRLPDAFDIDRCDARFVPLLGALVGYHFDATRDADAQRREIREAVRTYQHKGTLPDIRHALMEAGRQGEIEETFRNALRLNKRSRTNTTKLPGRIHSLGVYRVMCDEIVAGLRDALAEHHPAGTRVFFAQWLRSSEALATDPHSDVGRIVTMPSDVRPRDAFVVGRTALNSPKPLSWRESNWSYWRMADQVTVRSRMEQAGVLISRWHGRSLGGKLNAFTLNAERMLKLDLSERRLAFTCPIAVEPPDTKGRYHLRLADGHLNRSRLTRAATECRIIFREMDQKSEARLSIECATNLYVITRWPGE